MTGNKRFELMVNQHNQCDIVDWVESKEKNAICIYNDLGCYPFSSAPALCDILNELADENEQLKEENKELKDKNSRLQETLAFRSNQLALMEQLIDDLGSEEMARQMELILND